MRLQSLKVSQQHFIEQRVLIAQKKSEYQEYIDAKDDIELALSKLAEASQVEAVALYSELLTTLVSEVMGKKQVVILETRKFRNKVHLDLFCEEEGGHRVDIAEAKGGSICNLIAAGMRVVSIIQSPYRRFLFLDEPDCWLAPSLVGPFVRVLRRLCNEVGVQMVYISHHSIKTIGDDIYNVHLERRGELVADVNKGQCIEPFALLSNELREKNGGFGVEWLSGAGIRFIEIKDFMSHAKTRVSLAPGLTLLTGENDIGKTSVFRALKALSINDAAVKFIRHGKDFTSVTVGLENEVVVNWSFVDRKSIKSSYTVSNGLEEITIDVPNGEVPYQVKQLLSFGEVDTFDLHFSDQRDPLFLLNSAVKGHQRASFLNISDDFEVVVKMNAIHAKKLSDMRSRVKTMKEQLEEVNQSLACYRPLPVLLELENQTVNSGSSEAQKLESINKWIINEAKICEFDVSLTSLARLNSSLLLESFIGEDIHELFECIVEESSDHTQSLTQLSNAISDTQFKAPILNKINVIMNDSNESCASVVKLSVLQDTLNKKVESSTTIERLMNSINSNFGDIQICNECGQPLETHEVKH
jgi:energy-coupling factor transporter ATP-binding protein EcfA2